MGDQKENVTQEEQQPQEMAWLLEEKEQRGQESSRLSQGRVLLSACQHWWFGPLPKSSSCSLGSAGCPGRAALDLTAAAKGELPVVLRRRGREKKRDSRALSAGQ